MDIRYYYDINKTSVDNLNIWIKNFISRYKTELRKNIILVSGIKNNLTYTVSLIKAYEGGYVLSLKENSIIIMSAIINRENSYKEFRDSFIKQQVMLKKINKDEIEVPLFEHKEEVREQKFSKSKGTLVEPKGKSCSKCSHYEDTLRCNKRNCRLGGLEEAVWCKHYLNSREAC